MSRNKSNWDFLVDETGNYKIDLQKGFKGSQGLRGLKGEPGLKGDDSDKGEKGDDGLLGFKGEPGEKGNEGTFPPPTASDDGYVLQYVGGITQWVDPNGGTF